MKTGTLKELNVKPGDMVEYADGKHYTVSCGQHLIMSCGKEISYDYWDSGKGFTLISRATDTQTLWCDMTPEEKGALLLAHHEGEEIEVMGSKWVTTNKPVFHGAYAYRIKPEPKIKTVALCYRQDVGQVKNRIGTINLIDGEPDCDSIKMEKVQ